MIFFLAVVCFKVLRYSIFVCNFRFSLLFVCVCVFHSLILSCLERFDCKTARTN